MRGGASRLGRCGLDRQTCRPLLFREAACVSPTPRLGEVHMSVLVWSAGVCVCVCVVGIVMVVVGAVGREHQDGFRW